ncbi:leucine-rich repeat domain-containing protein [Fibrisoma limi]|uniref:leucine-rich repeat domain-containing protein n=1 Tax=Fibrisoma limi TaxID=663275 RepID=UPI00030D8C21|nr:hypothetical protein [Fibrisoma limi]
MWLTTRNRWLLVLGLVLGAFTNVQAQYGQKPMSELDLLRIWYPAYKPTLADFQTYRVPQPNAYLDLDDLLKKADSTAKIEALVISGDVLRKGGLLRLARLPHVRVLTVNGLTAPYADSLFAAIARWPVLERLTIDVSQADGNRSQSAQSFTLPSTIQRFPKLNDLRIRGNGLNWEPSIQVLAGMKTLHRLEVDHWQPVSRKLPSLAPLQQLRALKVTGQGWIVDAETIRGLKGLTDLALQDAQIDTATFQQAIDQLGALESLSINSLSGHTLTFTHLKGLKSLELSGSMMVDATTLIGLTAIERLTIRSSQSVDLSGLCGLARLRTLWVSSSGKSVQLPDCIGRLSQLTELQVENGLMNRLPATIGSLRQLRKLVLLRCGLDSLPATIGQLTKLQELNVSSNKLCQLPNLGQLRELNRLDVTQNQLTTLPDDIGQLTQLTTLNAGQNRLRELPASIGRLTKLSFLLLFNNQLERLPDELGKLKKLRILMIGDNQLTSLPNSLVRLDSLESLGIGKNRLRAFPTSFTRLRNLTNLYIGANDFTALPADLGELRQLQFLTISDVPITELPSAICELVNLRSLQISNTKLRLLPDNIGALSKLTNIMLFNNELIALPNSIGQWKEVMMLNLSQNRLEGLPNGIGGMTKLAILTITGKEKSIEGATGGIQQLPDSIVNCTNLRYIWLQHQPQLDVDDLFRKLNRMKNLSELTAINCNISRLPEAGWKDVTIEGLNVSSNLLTELPTGLLEAPRLRRVMLRDNRLPDLLNRDFFSLDALRVALMEAGTLPMSAIAKPNRQVSNAYQQMASQKATRRDWEGAMSDLQKAIDYMPDTTVSLPYAQRAEMHFFRKEYAEALADFDQAIKYAPNLNWQKQADSSFANQMLAQFWQRKSAVLGATGKYDEALSGVNQAARLLPASASGQLTAIIQIDRGRYLTLKNKLADADSSYRKAIQAYEKLPYAEPPVRLTVVELNLLTGQYDRAQRAIAAIPADRLQGGFATLKEYLQSCLLVLKGDQAGPKVTEQLTSYLAKHTAPIYGWSFDLFDNWLNRTKLPTEKVTALRQLTEATKERLAKPQ